MGNGERRLDDETLRSYVNKYQSGGIAELLKTNYSGRQTNIDESQLKVLCDEAVRWWF